MVTLTFKQLPIDTIYADKLEQRGIVTPSPVQAEAIPAAVEGRDVLAQSQTGTGKTLAYLLPVLTRIELDKSALQAVVVAPTQELAMQIVREAEALAGAEGLIVAPLIGGAALNRQLDKLKQRPQLAVGTPGRIRELLDMKKLKMHEVRTIIIDEVDHVLRQSGAGDTEYIMNRALRDRQLLFFSATLPAEVKKLASEWMKDPVNVGIEPDKRVADTITHSFIVSEERDRIDMLRRLVRHYNPKSSIVFVNDSDMIGEWESKLKYAHLSVGTLYGNAPKQERVQVLRRFREGEFQLLLATDVAARGLDIADLEIVFSLQPAISAEHYVHRAGRTGRMGRKGISVNLITERELFIMRKFERELNIEIQEWSYSDGKVRLVEEGAVKRKPQARKPVETRQSSSQRKTNDRHRDKKSKGAPKWLKAKQQDNGDKGRPQQ
ncbi:DEAD/DEAH box helicase [Paenibacillus agilis]|uniref:DEAD/DEAH box helicase n=1 Tax=Paenibacillus agilis TaxID=3020863 RepID=A0A559IHK4_9BACL|nr:DEAD/DEAH box helicase [Paenibacillus agilis]